MSAALPTPSPSANADSLISWQTIRPSTRPGASPTHAVCLPSVAKKRSAASRGRRGGVGTAGQLDQRGSIERRQRVEADRGAARVERGQRAGGAADRLRAALQRRLGLLAAGQVEDQERRVELVGLLGRPRTSQPACAAAAPQLERELACRRRSRSRRRRRRPRRLGVGRAVVAAVAGSRSSRAPTCGPSRPAATVRDGDRRRAPARLAEALLVERARDSRPTSTPDEVHQLERAHPEAAAEPADPVDLLERRRSAPAAAAAPQPERAGCSG